MTRGKVLFYLATGLFLAWIGYLAILVSITRYPVVLSRPQFLVSNLYILAQMTGEENHPNSEVQIQEVAWAANPADTKLKGTTIRVKKLDQCRHANGWTGPGSYILPLMKMGEGDFYLTETPPSPGFYPLKDEYRFRIYPANESARRQLEDIINSFTHR